VEADALLYYLNAAHFPVQFFSHVGKIQNRVMTGQEEIYTPGIDA